MTDSEARGAAGEPVVDVRHVRKTYGERAVLDGVDLRLGAGEILGFVGPNGAGKTTCLRSLVGLVRPEDGSLSVLGHDPRVESLAVRRGCSYLPGETSVYRHMEAREFLAFALKFYPARQDDLIEAMTKRFGLPMHRPVRALSAGMKQKLALIAALGPDVPLYILDEPDRALDQSVRIVLRELLDELRRRGKSVLLSSHHLAEIEAVCDRTAFIIGGRSVPETEVEGARQRLRGRLRVAFNRSGVEVRAPEGTTVEHMPDGAVEVRGLDDPIGLLRALPADAVESAEVGATRLEELYKELTRRNEPSLALGEADR